LPVKRARSVLGDVAGAGRKDLRKNEASRSQLDGCSYVSKDGTHLSYLVWEVPTSGSEAIVSEGLPPAKSGARSFDPKVGRLSAGAVLVTGPMAVAQVNVLSKGWLVQVSVTAKDSATAVKVTTVAARALARM
jgi:hypothetical protein